MLLMSFMIVKNAPKVFPFDAFFFYDGISRTGSGYPFSELLPSSAQSPFGRKVVVKL